MVQENGEKRARKENGTRNNTDSCWCFILVLTGFSMIIDKHWGPSCQASDPWRQNGLRVWGHTLFLRASRGSWSFPNMFHSSRGASCPCKYQPNEEACMRHWYHWRRPVTYLPFFFCNGKRLNPKTSMPLSCNFHCTVVIYNWFSCIRTFLRART